MWRCRACIRSNEGQLGAHLVHASSKLRHAGGQTLKGIHHHPDGLVMVSDHYSLGGEGVTQMIGLRWVHAGQIVLLC